MRVTHGMLVDTLLKNLSGNLARMERVYQQITSARRISRPSDYPVGTATVLRLGSAAQEIEQYLANVEQARTWLDLTDQALTTIGQSLQRVRELVVQAANDTLSADDRQAIWAELTALQEQIATTGNYAHAGQYLFAGSTTQTEPFDLSTDPPTYRGNNDQLLRLIDRGVTVDINVPGSVAIVPVLQAVKQARDAVASNDPNAIRATLATIDAAQTQLLAAQASVGARVNRLDAQRDRLLDAHTSTLRLLSEAGDTDMAEAVTRFSKEELTYRAALQAGARAIQPTLLDFLR
ncbi:flagellar hook-associated protein FlgL [Thermomicrobium sp. 4228-Ro]|uniref:flagellar hook-associated protein FlgL n=1 Tax=Thermomicrobium sp. 4228-Ro TaxID=2993937 RepID=UPI002248B0D5|nr:flagellar hook-associated protein FlgL [Thermomicrobium sp. 4228-Ro]MCX2727963.1 flagellar hook-associated protein FlgL [Thermomicrobium sp. 4228-Ro]